MEKDLQQALAVLKAGGVILYPTDTIWGIGCDASNEEAVQKVIALKNRPAEKSFIVLLEDLNKIVLHVRDVPEVAWNIVEYAEKPLTVIYPEGQKVAPSVLNADKSIAIRVTKDPFCKQLIRKLNKPLLSTSANISGAPSPVLFDDIAPELLKGVDYVVNHRQNDLTKNPPSTIIRLGLKGEIQFLRK